MYPAVLSDGFYSAFVSYKHFAKSFAETLKFWFESIHFYGTPKKEKQEDIHVEQVNRPLPSCSTEIEEGCIGNSSTQIYDFHDIADSKGKTTFPTYLEPPIIAIGTHKDQCMVLYILT